MQRVPPSNFVWLPVFFALYACSGTLPSMPDAARPAAMAAEIIEKPVPVPVTPHVETPAPPLPGNAPDTTIEETEKDIPLEAEEEPAPVADDNVKPFPPIQASEGAEPHIALLLPLKSLLFRSATEAVLQGFQAAANVAAQGWAGTLPVRVYPCDDERSDIVALYHQAIADGARAVVGPLTRSGTSALIAEKYYPVPTLALNIVESQPARNLYFFGMAVEAEAQQVAQMIIQQGLHKVIVISTQTLLAKRLQSAFEEQWLDLGGSILNEIEFTDDPTRFSNISLMPDTAAFFAVDAEKALLIRPYLPNKLPIFATSPIFLGNHNALANYDLNGIRFVDMPWLLQPDHAAVMIYPRAAPPLPADHERLYALGIDAFRLIQLMLGGQVEAFLPLDGVSGEIHLSGQTFKRISTPAILTQGQAQLLGTPTVPTPQIFPGQAVIKP